MNHRSYYQENKKYEKFLSDAGIESYNKYISKVCDYSVNRKTSFLDVGCGVGTVANYIASNISNIKSYRHDVSGNFIEAAKKGKGIFRIYDGKKIPFRNNSFDVVRKFYSFRTC